MVPIQIPFGYDVNGDSFNDTITLDCQSWSIPSGSITSTGQPPNEVCDVTISAQFDGNGNSPFPIPLGGPG